MYIRMDVGIQGGFWLKAEVGQGHNVMADTPS